MSAVRVKLTHCQVCGKKAYPDQRTAIRFALRYSMRRGTPLRVYREPKCGHLHLTSRPSKESR